jgi:AmmeMemoRadiSam system protein B
MNVTSNTVNKNSLRTRSAAVAGSWYSNNPKTLQANIDNLLAAAKSTQQSQSIQAIVAPHAGYQYSGATAADAYNLLRGLTFQRVLILGPAHYKAFHGLSIDPVDNYATPLGTIPLDNTAISRLRDAKLVTADLYSHQQEHSIEMQLPFLQRILSPGWTLIPILVGQLQNEDYLEVVQLLKPVVDSNTLIIASTDFTHYGPRFGYQPFPYNANIASNLEILDTGALNLILAKDADGLLRYKHSTGITMCGIIPVSILLRLLPKTAVGSLQTYTTSGKLTGDYKHSVSYMSITFHV